MKKRAGRDEDNTVGAEPAALPGASERSRAKAGPDQSASSAQTPSAAKARAPREAPAKPPGQTAAPMEDLPPVRKDRAAWTRSEQHTLVGGSQAPLFGPPSSAPPSPHRPGPQSAPLAPEHLATLRGFPELRGMKDDAFDEFVGHLWYRKLPAGMMIIEQGQEAEATFFVLTGEIRTEVDGRTVAMQQAPTTVGLLSLNDGRKRTATVYSFSACDVVMLSRGSYDHFVETRPELLQALIRHLTEELRRFQRRDEERRRSFDDHFHTPNARLIQGPYRMGDFPMTALWIEGDEASVLECLPPGVRPLLGGRYLLTFNDFPRTYSEHPSARGKSFSYRETTPFIPVIGPNGVPGVFSPELYLDSYMPIVLGRELYGFPKRFGVATFREKSIDLQIGSALVLRASWQQATPTDFGGVVMAFQRALMPMAMPAQLKPLLTALFAVASRESVRKHWPAVPVYVHSILPEAHSDASENRIDELVEIPFLVQSVGSFEILEGVEVMSFEDDVRPKDRWKLMGKAVAGVRIRMSAGFGRARRPVDYRGDSRGSVAPAIARETAKHMAGRIMGRRRP